MKENRSIFFLSLLMLAIFISWLYIVWFTHLLPEDTNKINVTISSITATLAPIALIVTYSNYLRKSGVDLRVKLGLPYQAITTPGTECLAAKYIIINHKDKNTYIPILYVIIDNEYAILINTEGFTASSFVVEKKEIPLGDIMKIDCKELSLVDFLKKSTTYRLGVDTFSEGSFISKEYSFNKMPGVYDAPTKMSKNNKTFKDYKQIHCGYSDNIQLVIKNIRKGENSSI